MTTKEITTRDFKRAVAFHGHTCPGLYIGYRAAKLAMKELGIERAMDEEVAVIVENNSCAVDALQSILGTTFGKGNLYFKDYGKQVYTVFNRRTGEAIRISLREFRGGKTKEESLNILRRLSDGELFEFKKVSIPLPKPAEIYSSIKCEVCSELTMETRLRIKHGKLMCIPCFKK
ncbi:MAG: FmdE family protein [Methanocellales archaeon]